VRLAFGGARVVVTHGDADSMPVAINADTSNRELERQLRAFDADILVLGHTHMAMLRTVRNGIVINPGAVGESRNPDWQPRWGWLEATPDGVVAHLEIVDHPLAPQRDDAPED
jgi:predicted phosphodiesterase